MYNVGKYHIDKKGIFPTWISTFLATGFPKKSRWNFGTSNWYWPMIAQKVQNITFYYIVYIATFSSNQL
jgi:hypothetical protein